MSAPFALYLASRSPRRRELLDQIGLSHQLLPADVVEQPQPDEAPETYVLRLALDKARTAAAKRPAGDRHPVLGADTVVALDSAILEKPRDRDHALSMLRRLSGREHRVLTGVAVTDGDHEASRLSVSHVHFRAVEEAELRGYVATGEADDKAGAYAIQGRAALFVTRIDGSHSGIMGLPLYETGELLRPFGIQLP